MSTEHQPAPHADLDGSERRRSMEREHERGLAADVAEPSSILTFDQKLSEADVATIKSLFAKAERLRKRAVKAEAALARVEAEADALDEMANDLPTEASGLRLGARSIRAALRGPDVEAAG